MADEILFERRADGLARITLNRPPALNALDRTIKASTAGRPAKTRQDAIKAFAPKKGA